MSTSPDRTVAGIVGGRYEIDGLIATGGMGSVYRARDLVLDRIVALKVLRVADDPQFVARFRTEATNAARLSHPNIVQVFDFGYADDAPYMAMEYVDGQTLREVLHARGVLKPESAARVAAQVAQALEHARKSGLVHRDIKPENILITTDGRVKVADFGLSRALAESTATQAGVLMGTAHYLAPEQVQGTGSDHRADVYALGVVLYEMLTGATPFDGDTPVVIAYKRVAEDVPSAMARNRSVPRALDVVVGEATSRRPEERYQTAGEMLEALREAVPRMDTEELGLLVHHTAAIPIVSEQTVVVEKRAKGAGGAAPVRARGRRRKWIALALVLALIGGAAYAVADRSVPRVKVPGVLEMPQVAAEQELRQRGFVVQLRYQNSETVDGAHVISQEPAAGALVKANSTVVLVISTGPLLISLPDVRGMTYAKAADALRDKGFTSIARKDVFDAEVRKGRVLSMEPAASTPVERDAKITVTVSKGPELIEVPRVIGDEREAARADLLEAGFKVKITEKTSDDVAKGLVISQSPKPGAKLEKGETVEIVVSKGPPLVTVPDILCATRRQAQDLLEAKGFRIEFEGTGRRVVDQDPAAKSKAPKGSTVTAYTGPGTRC